MSSYSFRYESLDFFSLPFQFVITITLLKCSFSFQCDCNNFLENIF